jgi:colanic acid biosynthesis glycosyl transferase WcaI
MRLSIVTHYFPPEELSMAFLVREFADGMASRGHHVDVLTGYPNWPGGSCFEGYSPHKFTREAKGALNVYRAPFYASPNGSFWQRAVDFKSFELAVRVCGKRLERPDLIYVSVPPNEDAVAARALANHFRCRYVLNVQDILPDSAIELGYVKNKLIISLLKRQEATIYHTAHHITVIGDHLKERITAKGIPGDKVSIIPNWIDAAAVAPMSRRNALRAEWAIGEQCFVALYAGTFGRIHDTRVLLEAANVLRDDLRIVFLMVGQGYDFQRNKELAATMGLNNVVMKEFVPRVRLRELQALADVSIVTMKPGFDNWSVPSKVLGYMAAGRGVLGLVDSACDTAQLIRQAECGAVLEPGNVDQLARSLRDLNAQPEIAAAWGRNARRYLLNNLDSRVVVPKLASLVEGLT